ncbi:hypothetical protein A9W99_23195 [Mycobacterium sp. 1164966.3]|uniref:nucleotide-binding protein n=1 Tax=Mycobacterium sp. 1164966.3 TaxID=1856861 RepID=UPI0007FE5115|nr:AAA family ATPase [Mycobacterium sp. 1164966.3]OBA78583.1 hypothetical protein A9W99_23195 [Mycobacterium sp. 1164966.3]
MLAKHTPAEDERGSLARPPWLPDEKKGRRVYLGRGKRQDKEDAGKHRADEAKVDVNGHDSVRSGRSPSQRETRQQRAVADPAIPDPAAKRDEILVTGPFDASAEFPPRRERIPVSRRQPTDARESRAEPEDAPEFRPRRVAVRYDRPRPHPDQPSPPEMRAAASADEPAPFAPPPRELAVEQAQPTEKAIPPEAEGTSVPTSAQPPLPADQEDVAPPVADSPDATAPSVDDGEPRHAEPWSAGSDLPNTPEAATEFEPPAQSTAWADDSSFAEAALEPESVSAEPVPEFQPEPRVEVVPDPEPVPPEPISDLSPEPDTFAESSASDEAATGASVPGELDDIELRAAALLEQIAARRAHASAAPDESVVDSTLGDESDAAAPEWLSAEFSSDAEAQVDSSQDATSEPETPAEPEALDESADDATETQWPPAEEPGVEAPLHDVAETDSPAEQPNEQEPAGPVVPAEAPSPAQDDPNTAPAAEERSKGPAARRPAPPPWQMAGSMISAVFERVPDEDLGVPHAQPPAPAAEPPAASSRHRTPHPQPPQAPPAKFRPGPPPGALPPWPPPPLPGPFPPPPWWPGPPPGQRAKKPPPASHAPATGQPPPAPRPESPGPPRPPVGVPPPSYQPFRVPPSIDEAEITNPYRFAPPSGWRRLVHNATGGHVNPGASRKERTQEHLLAEIRQPIAGDFRIAVLSIKGGVGKTTTTFGLGSALAMVRHDRVIAVDANPDRGTLAERVGDTSTTSTVRDLLSDPNIHRYADVRNHTLMAASRLEVLASEQDPAVAEVFGADDYRRTVEILRYFYNVILTDCGTGIMHSAMSAILDLAHTIVLVSSPAIDAARSASATLDWLMQHGHSGLVREAHVVLSASRPGSAALKLDKVYEHFQPRCRAIHLIPFDPHLAEGADVDFARLRPATRQAYLELAGAVAENFGRLRPAREQA